MTKPGKNEFIAISLDIVKRFKRPVIFDIYLRRTASDFTLVFKKGDLMDWERVNTYVAKGLKAFYVTLADYSQYTFYVETLGKELANPNHGMNEDEVLDVLKEMVTFTSYELTEKLNVSPRIVQNSSNIVCACMNMLEDDKKSMFKLIKLMSNHPYAAKHSVLVSMFAVMLAQESEISSEQKLRNIGLGAFLHDIGITQLKFDPEDLEVINAEQREEINKHPQFGKQIIDALRGVPQEVGTIILQHHEQPNGAGYPNNLKGTEIFPPAKMVAIADTFCALISKRSYREAFSLQEAFARMAQDELKFDRKLLRTFAKIFGITT
jgi:HD-GYP domain-containing protein (c-di-GMP phosphodiesterase class II)